MKMAADFLSRSWERPGPHARIATPTEARLYPVPGRPPNHEAALHLHPGSFAEREARFPFTRSQLDDANAPEHRRLHRIAIRDTPDEATLLALLRHELEHARQYRFDVATYGFIQVAQNMLGQPFHDARAETLRGSSLLYQLLPSEADANRAARACARDHGLVPTAAASPDYDHLFREPGDPQLETLPQRLVSLCALFPEYADPAREAVTDFDRQIRSLDRGLSDWWTEIRPHAGLGSYGQAALDAIPTQAAVDAGATAGEAWRAAGAHLESGLAAALASIDAAA
jgi:hypothetical protein